MCCCPPPPLPPFTPSGHCRQVNGRVLAKRIHVRIEHIQPSRCREDFLRRRETNDKIKHDAKVKGGEHPWLEGDEEE